jgi:deoxyribodipyrimidine photolyase-related protein
MTLRIVLGDQLNIKHSWFSKIDDSVLYMMAELRSETDYVLHHAQKLAGFFAAMRSFSKQLQADGHKVLYFSINGVSNPENFQSLLDQICAEFPINSIQGMYPDEFRLYKALSEYQSTNALRVEWTDSEHFFIPFKQITQYLKPGRSQLMESFYRRLRKETGILMKDNGEPYGEQWNFDKDNRKPLPKAFTFPQRHYFSNDVSEVWQDILASNCHYFGEINDKKFIWPITRKQALKQLEHFLAYNLQVFGSFQDAMTDKDDFLMHSRISFALNCKLISPGEVIDQAISYWKENSEQITLTQLEGFVRQILGWREFVRGIYWANMPEYAKLNALNAQHTLPDWFWTGKTKMACLKHAIGQSLNHAYAHHIQRLMLTGNFALLYGAHPDEVDQWYLGIYIDAVEWVEMPNTRGMSQYADGGIVGSKPYVSSANYIQKMSNYCTSCPYNPKTRTESNSCPFNSLYWNFYLEHEEKFRKNPRISMVYRNLDKMSQIEKEALQLKAADIRKNINTL